MIYLQQSLDLDPASPETVDRLVDLAGDGLEAAWERLGARLVGAFTDNAEWFSRATHLLEFDDLAAFDAFRARARDDAEWQSCALRLDGLAPRRRERLLEPLGAVPVARLHAGIEASAAAPQHGYSAAILEVVPGRMAEFSKLLEAAAPNLPILASLRAVAGNPHEVIDLWTGSLGQTPYAPADERMFSFFRPLREVAPRERIVNLQALPYSPLS